VLSIVSVLSRLARVARIQRDGLEARRLEQPDLRKSYSEGSLTQLP
jgi:hypothetical protein